ncbi:MAG TPA: TolC family protein [Kofleriaceae bacterium]|nr:TolC family protein [Kofleriaceae bacterium]
MKVRLTLAAFLAAGSSALAQPAPQPQQRPAGAPEVVQPATTELGELQKDVDGLFSPGGLTADQAASRAAKVSPEVMRAVAELDVAIANTQAAELSRVPLVSGKASYTRLSPIDPLSFGPGFPPLEFPDNSYALNGQVAVPVSDYFLRFPKIIDAAKLAQLSASTRKTSAEIGAAQEARLAYYEWLRAQLQVLVGQHQLASLQTVVKQMKALADAQRVSKADLMRVQSQEAEAQRLNDQLSRLAALREEQLRLLIGAGDEKLTLGEDPRLDVTPPPSRDLDDLIKEASHNRLELRALDFGIEAKEKQRDSEKANQLPTLSAFASGDYANPNQRIFPQKEEWNFTWAAGVQLSWTLNNTLFATNARKRIASETDALRADREAFLRGTRIELLAAQQAVQVAQLSLDTTRTGLEASQEGYRVRRELLNAERATAVELVDAQTDLTRALIAAINARVDLRVAMAQLAHALGEDAPKSGH